MHGTRGRSDIRHLARLTLWAALASTSAMAGELRVHLDHLRPGATLRVALYNDARQWRRGGHPYAVRTAEPEAPVAVVDFADLPPGHYAVRVEQAASGIAAEPPPLFLPRHGDSGRGGGIEASFEHAAIAVEDEDPEVRVHLYTDTRY
jgi:uncharacterized protein (DUF2141 family)